MISTALPASSSRSTSHTETQDTSSILNRKRELTGLPGSFSSNLGRRNFASEVSDSRKTSAANGTVKSRNRSVKSIVAWLESSASRNADCVKQRGEELKMDVSTGSISSIRTAMTGASSSSSLSPQQSQHFTLIRAPDVEEYSLTLLNYKEYFTERPLGRCLDDWHQQQSPTDSSSELDWFREERPGLQYHDGMSTSEDDKMGLNSTQHRLSPLTTKVRGMTQVSEAMRLSRRDEREVAAF